MLERSCDMSKVLVVDDDVRGREPICRFLKASGHEVECASDGCQALSSILDHIPDVVVLDLFMPGMDGASLLKILRSYLRLQSLPVVVLTGAPDSPLVARVRSLNVHSVLTKAKATLKEILRAVDAESQHAHN